MVGIGVILGIIGAAYGAAQTITPLQRQLTYYLNYLMPNAELDPDSLVELYLRGKITKGELIVRMKNLGYDESKTEQMIEIHRRLLNIEQAIYLYRRGVINNDKLAELLKANGVDPNDALLWFKLTEYFPSPGDIIRFAVREVFTPEIVQKYRMDEDLPKEYLELAKQVGIPEQVAIWYWRAHWDLPSLSEGIELFRRKVITKEELETLMRTLDINPYWREKLIELAYELPTRVDLRRMYEMGVISKEQLIDYYEKLGYKPEDAKILADWTEMEYNYELRELNKNNILELYEIGEIDRDTAKKYLIQIGFNDKTAEYILTLKEYDIVTREAKEQLSLLIEQYKAGVIDLDTLYTEASKLPLSDTAIRKAVLRAYREKQAKVRIPSLATLKKWLKLGIIDVETFKEKLSQMGYLDEDIDRFIMEIQKVQNIAELAPGE